MSLLENVKSGKQPMPPRIEIYGVEGIGKSSLAASAPNAVFLPTEDGLSEIDCHRFPLANNFADIMSALEGLSYQDLENPQGNSSSRRPIQASHYLPDAEQPAVHR